MSIRIPTKELEARVYEPEMPLQCKTGEDRYSEPKQHLEPSQCVHQASPLQPKLANLPGNPKFSPSYRIQRSRIASRLAGLLVGRLAVG